MQLELNAQPYYTRDLITREQHKINRRATAVVLVASFPGSFPRGGNLADHTLPPLNTSLAFIYTHIHFHRYFYTLLDIEQNKPSRKRRERAAAPRDPHPG